MGKKIILLLAIVISALLLRPSYMWKADVVDAIDFDDFSAVEAIGNKVEKASLATIATSYERNYVSSYSYRSTVAQSDSSSGYGYVAPNSITILGRNIGVYDVDSTAVDAGNHVNKFGDRFYYGHNSGIVFGGLPSVGVGSTFTITYGGVARTYRVAKTMVFEKNTSNGRLQLNGEGNYMKSVANAKSGGVQYDVSLMTCYGTSYGNGDASHRFVIFANAI